jgi:hypothetical protein
VGRGLAVGADLGVGVGLGVELAVAVGVAVGVGEGVGVAVGVRVGRAQIPLTLTLSTPNKFSGWLRPQYGNEMAQLILDIAWQHHRVSDFFAQQPR